MSPTRRTSVGPGFDIGCNTDVGMEREVNQDSARAGEVPGGYLVVIADGMGGHAAGEKASQIVVEELFRQFEAEPYETPPHNLYVGVQNAHEAVLQYADTHGTHGMGSTAVAAFIRDNEVFVAYVGDSPLYHFKDGVVEFRTVDHTRVQRMVEAGVLSEEEAKTHPDANVITRAVGHLPKEGDQEFEADVRARPLEVGGADTILLCSDGLFDLVEDREMIDLVAGTRASDAVDYLIRLANERGGHDNISVAVVHFGAGTSRPPAESIAALATESPDPQPEVASAPESDPEPERPIRETVPETAPLVDAGAPNVATTEVISAARKRPQPVARRRANLDLKIVVAFLAGIVFVLLLVIVWLVLGRTPEAGTPEEEEVTEAPETGQPAVEVDRGEPARALPPPEVPLEDVVEPGEATPDDGGELQSQPLEPGEEEPAGSPPGAELPPVSGPEAFEAYSGPEFAPEQPVIPTPGDEPEEGSKSQ
jgi:PPM family protein phosphatase